MFLPESCRVTIDVTPTTIQKRLRSIEYKSPQQKTIEKNSQPL
mgnify:CR=1 FL=1